jgi:glycosyltransferase involved in cell wall biosynthesis/SAM-dependent methyltransferase
MIVKNEAPVIRRCLDSIRPWIDCWVIVDTGSEDGTQDLIREHFKDIPGELHERPWVDFAHNRTEAIQLARPRADYLIFLDADEILVIPPDLARPSMEADAYQVEYRYDNLVYCRPSLVATRRDWIFEGVLHEYLVCRDRPAGWVIPRWEGPHIRVFPDGARSQDPDKFRRDAAVLEKALEREPDNARYAFYLAQSYRDAGEPLLSLAAYQRRAAMAGSVEETWHALYQIARLSESLERPETEVVQAYLRAHAFRPHRAEVPGSLARYLRLRQRYAEALSYAAMGMRLPRTTDLLFVEHEFYQWRCLDEFAVSAYWTRLYRESLEACDRLLADPLLPDGERERILANRAFALQRLGEVPAAGSPPRKLHLGCGRTILPGWLNLDRQAAPGVDLAVDLEDCAPGRIPLPDDAVDEILAAHLVEHIRQPLPLMQELHRVARPGCRFTIRTPYGSSDDAWEDPTHVRPYFLDSFSYFGQPYYWRADYGYRGDWEVETIELWINDASLQGEPTAVIAQAVRTRRNVVTEMVATLRAVKPVRPPLAELRSMVKVDFRF